jgi:hypothetical protein
MDSPGVHLSRDDRGITHAGIVGMRAVRTYVTDLNGQRLSRRGVLKRQLITFVWFGLLFMFRLYRFSPGPVISLFCCRF